MSSNFSFSYLSMNSKTNAVLAPNNPSPMTAKEIAILRDDVLAITNGSKRIYAVGTVMYYDAFGGEIMWTNFCFSTDFKRLSEDNGGFDTCPIHNSADWNQVSKQSPVTGQIPME